MNWMLMPYRRYFDFSGRSRRMEYWMFTLLWVIVYAVFYGYAFATMPSAEAIQAGAGVRAGLGVFSIVLAIFVLGSFIPQIAVTVRRLHDTDRSGWWWWIQLVPFVGFIVMLVFMCLDGTPGANRFGPDPKGNDAAVFA